jgi:bifunctional N-acetylglucosamine-1-phosphate-uridyltransferase/glucosamine-1-phosphate-acetyltransferase GlmU-like protein
MNQLTVVIMAAGEGKRMNSSIPKVLHLFKGIPILIRIILEVIKLNPNKIIIITGKYDLLIKSTIKEYFENNYKLILTLNEYEKIKELIFLKQNIPNGTGDAIKCTLDNYKENENILILNGDTPLLSYTLLDKFLQDSHSIFAKILVSKLECPFGYGRIIYDENNNFIEIKEEKDCMENQKKINIINAGIYFFNSNLLKKYIPLIDNNNFQKEYYLTDIFKIMRNDFYINNLNIDIKIYLIEEELKYQIYGVNTQQELKDLEEKY